MWSHSVVMSDFNKWAWSGSREQFLHCGLKKFRHSKSSVYRWYTQLDRCRFVYDTYKTMKAIRTRHGWVHTFTTHRPTLTLQLHNRFVQDLLYCTVEWQLARFQLTRRIARFLGDSWASCTFLVPAHPGSPWHKAVKWLCVCSNRKMTSPCFLPSPASKVKISFVIFTNKITWATVSTRCTTQMAS